MKLTEEYYLRNLVRLSLGGIHTKPNSRCNGLPSITKVPCMEGFICKQNLYVKSGSTEDKLFIHESLLVINHVVNVNLTANSIARPFVNYRSCYK